MQRGATADGANAARAAGEVAAPARAAIPKAAVPSAVPPAVPPAAPAAAPAAAPPTMASPTVDGGRAPATRQSSVGVPLSLDPGYSKAPETALPIQSALGARVGERACTSDVSWRIERANGCTPPAPPPSPP